VGVEEVQVALDERDAGPAGQLDHRLPADPAEDELLPRRVDRAVPDQEDVAPRSFGQVPARVEQDRPRLRVGRLRLQVAERDVHVVVGLGPRAQALGRDAAHGRDDHLDAVPEEPGPGAQRQRLALDDHGRSRLIPDRLVAGLEAAGDPLGHPVVLVGLEEPQVLAEDLLGDLHQPGHRESGIDLDVAERPVEPVEVLPRLEDPVPEGARGVEHGVPELEAAVPEGDADLALGDDPAVEVGDPLSGAHVVPPREVGGSVSWADVPPVAASPRPSSFVALRHRNFRLLWAGQLVSFSGSTMQTAAILWHVALLVPPERKGLALGMVGLVRLLPIVIFGPMSGVIADARERRLVMLTTQSAMALVAATLAVLTFRGLEVAWPIYVLASLGAAAGSFDAPARQSLVPNLVPPEHLPNAIGLMTIMSQSASVIGPSLGGIVIALLGIGWAYALNALSFLAVLAALLLMRGVPGRAGGAATEISRRALVEGLRFVFRSPLIRSALLLDGSATFFSSATALLPIFAQDVLGVGARGYGWLYAAPSIGALVASALMVRLVDRIERRGRVLLWAVAVYGVATVAFGLSRAFWLTFLCLAGCGAADTVSMVLRHVIRQLETPDHLRGRVAGLSMVFFQGAPQLGELEAGVVAYWVGAPLSVVLGGLGSLATTAWIARSTPALRHYRR